MPSLERFRTSAKYQDRPAAADIAFGEAAFADGMPKTGSKLPLKATTSPAIPARRNELHTSGGPWRRRETG